MVPWLGTVPIGRWQQGPKRTKDPKSVHISHGSPNYKNSSLSKLLRIEDPLVSWD